MAPGSWRAPYAISSPDTNRMSGSRQNRVQTRTLSHHGGRQTHAQYIHEYFWMCKNFITNWTTDPRYPRRIQLGPHDDAPVRRAIQLALDNLFLDNSEVDLASYCGHNLIGGLARFMLGCAKTLQHPDYGFGYDALDFIQETAWLVRRYAGRNDITVRSHHQ